MSSHHDILLMHLRDAADRTKAHVDNGNNVCHDNDVSLATWLKTLPMDRLMTLDGYSAHIAQHCAAELKRRDDYAKDIRRRLAE